AEAKAQPALLGSDFSEQHGHLGERALSPCENLGIADGPLQRQECQGKRDLRNLRGLHSSTVRALTCCGSAWRGAWREAPRQVRPDMLRHGQAKPRPTGD